MEIRSGVFGYYSYNDKRLKFEELVREVLYQISIKKDYEYSDLEIITRRNSNDELEFVVINQGMLKEVASYRVDEERKEGEIGEDGQEHGHLDIDLVATVELKEAELLTEEVIKLLGNTVIDEDGNPMIGHDTNLKEFIRDNYYPEDIGKLNLNRLKGELDSYGYTVSGINED